MFSKGKVVGGDDPPITDGRCSLKVRLSMGMIFLQRTIDSL